MPRRSTVIADTLPAPVMGINSKDPISQMEPIYCTDALNMWSDGNTVDLRLGNTSWSTAGASTVWSLYEYHRINGTRELMAVEGAGPNFNLYSITTGGVATNRLAAVSTQGEWWFATFSDLCFCGPLNGSLQPQSYNGAAAAAAGFTGPASANSLTGGAVYKGRLYFFEYNSLNVWYAALGAVTGACTSFPLATLTRKGGQLAFIGSTTRYGQQDQSYFVALTDQGELLIYQGDYPGSPTWALIGHYFMPPLVSRRSWCYLGPNLIFMTRQGLISLSDVMAAGGVLTYMTDRITGKYKEFLSTSGNDFWVAQPTWSSETNMLICNMAAATGDYNRTQFVMNTVTNSWWRWACTPYQINCITTFNNGLYFGSTAGVVGKFYNGYQETGGREIKLAQAFSYFGNRATTKQFVEARPVFYAAYEPYFKLGITPDYDDSYPTTDWSSFASALTLHRPRLGLQGIGRAGSLRLSGRLQDLSGYGRLSLQATDILYNEGDII